MKILVVCSFNNGEISPFIQEQVESLRAFEVECEYFLVKHKGVKGYLKSFLMLRKKINSFNPSIIHAHYGLSGLLANFQRRIPVVTTFHGSDINNEKIRIFSFCSALLSKQNIYVTKILKRKLLNIKGEIIPCGVDIKIFQPIESVTARQKMNLDIMGGYILFSSSFSNKIKNFKLAKKAIELSGCNMELLELNNYTREQVALLMNSVEFCLMTSISEGSPQFIKEAMACNAPIITTRVGDAEDVIGNTENCFVCNHSAIEIANAINAFMNKPIERKTDGRKRILTDYSLEIISLKIYNTYCKCI